MRHVDQALTVAEWEFRRYFKWKDQIIGLVVFALIGFAWAGAAMVAGAKGGKKTVALAGVELEAERGSRLELVAAPPDRESWVGLLEEGELDAVLQRRTDGSFELLVLKDPGFRTELEALATAVVRRERLAAAGLSPAELETIVAPVPLEVRFTDPNRERRGKAEKIAAAVAVGALLMAVFTSMAYMMTGIAGEKQLRVTESVVSAISPQAWIDGKVLGISAFALATVVNLGVSWAVVAFVAQLATGFAIPTIATRPTAVLVMMVFTALGLLLWNAFFAAVSSTLDDPNTSSRSSLMMLPMLPVVMSIALFKDADSLLAKVLAIFPLTSAPALPIRMVLSDPGWLEIGVSTVLLVGTIWLVRALAGKIFEMGMMLYGKEPSLTEIARWIQRPR